ncbi:MAG: FAD-dependent oxidoreductase [Candidatus Hydrogenedentes bacterium]|nr:FAD-dependent oxidoreductase [Candidatus Hydrogenedentota bacterium]
MTTMLEQRNTGAAVLLLALLASQMCPAQEHPHDLVVYGGTAGGALAAIAAAREGLDVALVEPKRHVGGMVTGGLGATDFGKKYVIGGYCREFFARLGRHYGEDISWFFEPHVAQQTMDDWLAEAKVKVYLQERVDHVEKEGTFLRALVMESGERFAAPVFIDASYEGDLLPRAGISYTWGREGRAQYNESLAGRLAEGLYHQFSVRVSPFDDQGNLIPLVQGSDPGEVGAADKKVQAYNFRLCLSNNRENQVPFPKPSNYDPARYELLRRYLQAKPDIAIKDVLSISMMPNGKTDINNKGPVSTDHIGASWDYPEADYAKRAAIWEDHKQYVLGFLYFLANDESVPKRLREEVNSWGLAKDEFADNDHWPHQLYVREARRMIGEYVMPQRDAQEDRAKVDSIGMGSYNIDSHHVQRFATPDGAARNEGDVQVRVEPYEIPYGVLLPKREECTNLLVPVCVSASHVAYSTLRMEPQYMIMGHAAGVAAALAAKQSASVHEIDRGVLQQRLREQKQVLSMLDASADFVDAASLPGIVVDNTQAQVTGEWFSSNSVNPYVGTDYLHQEEGGAGSVRFVPALGAAGQYEIRVAYSAHPNRASNVRVVVHAADGDHVTFVDQSNPPAEPPFVSLGIFPLEPGNFVDIETAKADGYVVADAVQFLAKPK